MSRKNEKNQVNSGREKQQKTIKKTLGKVGERFRGMKKLKRNVSKFFWASSYMKSMETMYFLNQKNKNHSNL